VYIILNTPALNAATACSLIFQGECGGADPSLAFTVNVAAGPAVSQHKSQSIARNSNELKIIHISDLHYDPHYLVDGWAVCIEPVCCRRIHGIAPNPADRAGRWGDYRDCDSPWEVVEEVSQRIRDAHPDADYIYYTGDTIDHGVWETTIDTNKEIMARTYDSFRRNFGRIPVYNVLGNHEGEQIKCYLLSLIT